MTAPDRLADLQSQVADQNVTVTCAGRGSDPSTVSLLLPLWAPLATALIGWVMAGLDDSEYGTSAAYYIPGAVLSSLLWAVGATVVRRRTSAPLSSAAVRGLIVAVGASVTVPFFSTLLDQARLFFLDPSSILPTLGMGFAVLGIVCWVTIPTGILGSMLAWHVARSVRSRNDRRRAARARSGGEQLAA